MPILIDGNVAESPYNEYELSTGPDGCYPPYYLFDTGDQEHISEALPTRNAAEKLLSMTWRFASPDDFLDIDAALTR